MLTCLKATLDQRTKTKTNKKKPTDQFRKHKPKNGEETIEAYAF
jgi:hypothetical protein